jgi:hypothetical protein
VAKDEKKSSVQFVNYDFDESTKKKFKAWKATNEAKLPDIIDKLLDSGFNLSVKIDSYGGGYASHIVPADPKSPLAGWILSGRAGTPCNAILGVIYRHLVVFEGNWPTDDIRRRGLDDD